MSCQSCRRTVARPGDRRPVGPFEAVRPQLCRDSCSPQRRACFAVIAIANGQGCYVTDADVSDLERVAARVASALTSYRGDPVRRSRAPRPLHRRWSRHPITAAPSLQPDRNRTPAAETAVAGIRAFQRDVRVNSHNFCPGWKRDACSCIGARICGWTAL